MKKVLLTGAKGFIGSHCLAPLLERGFTVHAISSRGSWGSAAQDVEWHHADLHRPEQILKLMVEIKPDYLLHLAWDVSHGTYWNSMGNIRWVRSSLSLLEAFMEAGGKRALAAGSCAEYDWSDGCCSESSTPLKPATFYGVCKDALQKMMTAACRELKVSCSWGRLFFLYGPGEYEKRLIPSVITSLLAGQEALCTHGEQERDYLYVKDAAAALVALLDSRVEGPVNIASGQAVKLKTLIAAAAEETGRPELVRLGAISAAEGEPALIVADTGRLNEEVGWQPRYSTAEGMQETLAWWKKNKNQ